MRPGWVVPGVILLLIMLLFLYVPLPYTQQHVVDSAHPLVLYCPEVLPSSTPSSAYCLSGNATLSLSWYGGNSTTWVELIPCRTFGCTEINNTISPTPKSASPWFGTDSGATGSFTLWVPTNQSLMILTNSSGGVSVTINWNVMPEFTLIWSLFVLVGLIIAVVGLLLPPTPRSKRGRRPPEEEDTPPDYDGSAEGSSGEEGSSTEYAPPPSAPGDPGPE